MRSAIAAVPSIGRAAHVERAAREADATQDLYERYSGQIFGFCVNKLGSRDEAEDALQSTFLNAHRALQRGVRPESELAWLFKIAHNVCLTRRRSTWRRGRVESPSDFAAVQDVVPAPSRELPDDLMRLTEALEHMPDSQRHAILLREWQGLSYHEIAEELQLSQSAVETLLFRARRTLASNLEAQSAQPSRLSRMRKALDAGALLAALKGLFEGGAAVKVATIAVAASGTVVVAAAPPPKPTAEKQAAMSVAQAAPAPVIFERSRPQPSVPQTKPRTEAAATSALPSAPAQSLDTTAAPLAAPTPERPKAKDEPKANPPGQARKQEPAARANGNSVKVKRTKVKIKTKAKGNGAVAAAPVETHGANGNGQPDEAEKAKGPKK